MATTTNSTHNIHDSLLQSTEMLLRTQIAPQSEAMDWDPEALRSALHQLGEARLLSLQVPTHWGGVAMTKSLFYHFQELIARYSGALAFLQAQHQSAGALLSHSSNQALQQTYLPQMGDGTVLLGIGFAHLRRTTSPLKAIPVAGGYRLEGQVPWVTGWGFFQGFIAAALLPDGQAVYGIVPLQTCDRGSHGTLTCSPPMKLAAMTATQTVSIEFDRWFLAEAEVVAIKPAGALQKNDQLNVLNHSFFALGNAQAGLTVLEQASQEKSFPFLRSAWTTLNEELETCRSAIYHALDSATFPEKLSLRAWAIELAGRCAQAAVTASSGAANLSDHPAQRIYREALLFTVSGQTTAVMEATLEHLVQRSAHPTEQFH